jgi:tRNA nucleotidyltransferase (CCA-adding enzyme)
VGGPIRDTLLGSTIKDLDLVLEGDAPTMAQQLAEELGGEVLVHARFGTATIVLGECRVDLATARKETYSHPGALPDVAPGTIHDDLARRDFSINALALPLAESEPRVLDPHGGVADLRAGLIRILHRNSFVDDPTRICRAIRYEQRLGFHVEEETLARLKDAISQGYLHTVSGDRLRHELEYMLQEENPHLALRRCMQLGVLAAIHPSLGNERDLLRLVAGGPVDSMSYLATLVYRLSNTAAEALVHRLNMPRSWATVVLDTVRLRQRESELAAPSLSRSQVLHLIEDFSSAAVVGVARITDSSLVVQRLEQYLTELRYIGPALNGGELVSMGVPQGPLVGEVLRMLRNARLDQQVSTETEERSLVREFLAVRGG